MNLRVYVRIDPYQHFDRLLQLLGSSPDVVQVKFAVNIDQDAMFNCQLKLPGLLAIAIEDSSAVEQAHVHDTAYI